MTFSYLFGAATMGETDVWVNIGGYEERIITIALRAEITNKKRFSLFILTVT